MLLSASMTFKVGHIIIKSDYLRVCDTFVIIYYLSSQKQVIRLTRNTLQVGNVPLQKKKKYFYNITEKVIFIFYMVKRKIVK